MIARARSAARVSVVVAAIFVISAAATSCRQVAGIDDRSVGNASANDAAPSDCGSLASAMDMCSQCLIGSCCEEARACDGDAACHAAFSCIDACAAIGGDGGGGAEACRASCRAGHGAGLNEGAGASLAACEAGRCAKECDLSCGGYAYPNAVCASCATSRCCTPATVCSADAECNAYSFCARSCRDDSVCIGECAKRHPRGLSLAQSFGRCTSDSCGSACGHGWDCLGAVKWPAAFGPTTLHVTVGNFLGGPPLAGIAATACDRADVDCTANPIATKPTDANGRVDFEFPGPFDGYVQITGAEVKSALLFFPYPLGGDFSQTWNVLTNAELDELAPLVGTLDPERGQVVTQMRDCTGAPTPGLTVAAKPSDAQTRTYYLADMLPSKTATSTDASGVGVIVDVPPGTVTVEATITPPGVITSSRAVIVRKGWITYHPALPTP